MKINTLTKKIKHYLYKSKWWRLKNTIALIISLIIFSILAGSPLVDKVLTYIGDLGYIGAFITGVFFVSTFTVAPAVAVLFHIAGILHPLEVAVLAGLGAMVGDFIMLRFFKDKLFEELRPYARKIFKRKLTKIFSKPYFAWTMPVFGAIVVASPLPDELGISMMGLSKIKNYQFIALSFLLNTVGIFLIATASVIV